MKYLLHIFALVAILLIVHPPSRVLAVGEFQADYDVQYAISPAGKTIVTQHVTLTNKLSNFYPQKYSLLLDSDKISNVIAYDDGGVITPAISVKDGKTDLTLSFNTKALGVGKSTKFSLRYEHAGVASKNGSIWEVYVPGVVNDPDVGTYEVTLSVPPTFGEIAYLSPYPANDRKWTKDQMIQGGISAAYGKKQQYAVHLTYSLQNNSITPKKQTIALPPETAFQTVSVVSIDPRPESVTKDNDGNWLAEFLIPAGQSILVKASLDIGISLTPIASFSQPAINMDANLMELPFWQTSDDKIQQYAKMYKTPRDIYNFVSRTLTYDYSRINKDTKRIGAKEILAAPTTALCMEFTDLFISIARAAGIPARRIVGYAYTNNTKLRPLSLVTDVLHAWPEYYDTEKKLWIPIDPTWANTTGGQNYFDKLDFNHIVFAIQGESSDTPYPAGFYHDKAKNTKDVEVEFSDVTPSIKPQSVETKIVFPSKVTSGKRVTGSLVIENTSGVSVRNVSISASSTLGELNLQRDFPELLPYGTLYIPLDVTFPQTITPIKATIQAITNGTTVTQEVTIHPLYVLFTGILLVTISFVAFGAIVVWILLWKRQKKK
ncbi:MAG: transglutaminase-like domain-containing protein [Patescibacteria group bacterium]